MNRNERVYKHQCRIKLAFNKKIKLNTSDPNNLAQIFALNALQPNDFNEIQNF